jgi:hypothetical protein
MPGATAVEVVGSAHMAAGVLNIAISDAGVPPPQSRIQLIVDVQLPAFSHPPPALADEASKTMREP